MQVRRVVAVGQRVPVKNAQGVQALVQPVMRGLQPCANLAQSLRFGTWRKGIDIRQRALDLIQNSQSVRLYKDRLVTGQYLDGRRVGGDVSGAPVVAAAHAKRDP